MSGQRAEKEFRAQVAEPMLPAHGSTGPVLLCTSWAESTFSSLCRRKDVWCPTACPGPARQVSAHGVQLWAAPGLPDCAGSCFQVSSYSLRPSVVHKLLSPLLRLRSSMLCSSVPNAMLMYAASPWLQTWTLHMRKASAAAGSGLQPAGSFDLRARLGAAAGVWCVWICVCFLALCVPSRLSHAGVLWSCRSCAWGEPASPFSRGENKTTAHSGSAYAHLMLLKWGSRSSST